MFSLQTGEGGRPGAEAVRAELERILASKEFRSAPQLGAFLTFVIERALEGKPETIKGYTIATEALGRPKTFDPQADPIVRVEAMRLRRALTSYYAGAGVSDPVVITIPRGGYVPSFAVTGRASDRQPRRMTHVLAAVGGVGLTLAFTALFPAIRGEWLERRAVEGLHAGNPSGAPMIAVPPIANRTGQAEFDAIAADLRSMLIQALARFEDVTVLGPGADPASAAFRVEGRIETGSGPVLSIMVVERSSGEVVWTHAGNVGDAESRLGAVRLIATMIGRPNGVAMQRAWRARRAGAGREEKCMFAARAYFRRHDRALHAGVRSCLEQAVAAEAASLGRMLTLLARLYIDEHRYGFNARPGTDPLNDALTAARRAAENLPGSAWASQTLCDALLFRGEFEKALHNCREARERNPFDIDLQALVGGRLILSGEYDRGASLIEEALEVNPEDPSWYSAYLFLAYWRKGELDRARIHANRIPPDADALGQIVRAIAAGEQRQPNAARQAIEALAPMQPEIHTAPRETLLRHFPEPGLADAVLAALTRAGLPAGPPAGEDGEAGD